MLLQSFKLLRVSDLFKSNVEGIGKGCMGAEVVLKNSVKRFK